MCKADYRHRRPQASPVVAACAEVVNWAETGVLNGRSSHAPRLCSPGVIILGAEKRRGKGDRRICSLPTFGSIRSSSCGLGTRNMRNYATEVTQRGMILNDGLLMQTDVKH